MKNMKKIVALMISVLLVLSSFAALAAGDTGTDPEGYENAGAPYKGNTNWDDTWSGTKDGTISVGGLEEGDTVKFFRVLAYDQDAHFDTDHVTAMTEGGTDFAAGSWKLVAPFTEGSGEGAITAADVKAILTEGISSTLAGKIAKLVDATPEYVDEADTNGIATAPETGKVNDGLYVAIVVPKNTGWMYNPIFVASDYYTTTGGDKSSTWTAAETPLSYSDRAMAKKSPIEIIKEAQEPDASEPTNEQRAANDDYYNARAAGVGDTVNYTVKTTIPEFADNYTAPLFVVTDQLTNGLKLDQDSIKVYTATVDNGTYTRGSELTTSGAFTITDKSDRGYKVTFASTYLLGLNAAQPIWIEYSAEVTEAAVTNVNKEENTVTLEYSHEPSVDSEGEGKKVRDKTHHYTWTIDGQIWGNSSWRTIESVKVGLDKDGNEIKQTKEIANGREIGALKDAEFKLYTDEACEHEYTKGLYGEKKLIKSDEYGYLNIVDSVGISGLDAGTYYLKETKAPDGYIKQQDAVKIEIIPVYYDEITWTDADGCVIKCNDLLKSYTVEINDVQTAGYTIKYNNMKTTGTAPVNDESPASGELTTKGEDGEGTIIIGNEGPIKVTDNGEKKAKEEAGKIKNTQGVELPSTGGIGTTLFYVGGGILILLAVVMLVTKRRMSSND